MILTIVLIGKNLARDGKAWITSAKCRSQRDGDSQSYRTVQLQVFQITLEVDLQEISVAGNKHLKSRFPKKWHFFSKWTKFWFYQLKWFGWQYKYKATFCYYKLKAEKVTQMIPVIRNEKKRKTGRKFL